MTRRALFLLALVTCLAQRADAPPRVAIVRWTAYAFDDEQISLMVQVDPRPENRALVIAAVDDGLVVRSSREQLDGEQARRTRWIEWRLPAGELLLTATLFESRGEVARATRPIHILSRLGP